MKQAINFFFLCTIIAGCGRKATLFQKVDPSHSGIHFRNDIPENDSINILDESNVYNGGGVGIADFNNDGLPDIYFTGNAVGDKLYLNKGNLKFEDITATAGVEGQGKWSRGVSIVDINNDGLPDIYISCTFLKDSIKRENILYINQGLNKEGIPVFKDMAKEYGLNDNSYTTQAAFFDYDNDGDLDVYLAVNEINQHDNLNNYKKIMKNGESPSTGRLYRNDWDPAKGHPVFTNVSRQAGILQEGYSHAVTICDINQDGWKDIYVTNDYLSENILYINNGNGTFTNHSKDYFKHTAFNAMGADVVDINNDGLSDVIELDMNPEDNYRKKTMLGSGNYQSNLNNDYYGYQYQYVRNCLQLNMGNTVGSKDSLGHPVFSDIGFYSGLAETDWSWAPVVADFDNDGFRDVIVTNGFPKDVTDHDFISYRNTAFAINNKDKLLAQIPVVKISNYAFRNNGNLQFSNVTSDWGFDQPTFSNGAVTADLDNDGDLDVVINNINDEALVYENKTNDRKENRPHYLQVSLEGGVKNKDGFGTWVKIFYDHGKQQVYETNPVRGYLSSNQNMISFGLGDITVIDSLVVIWPDNKEQVVANVSVDQRLKIRQAEANKLFVWQQPVVTTNAWFSEISGSLQLMYDDPQKDFNDFSIQKLLPHKISETGPYMTVGDVNNDGMEDLVIGGAAGHSATIFIQKRNGTFERRNLLDSVMAAAKLSNDKGVLLFDADGDKDLDLYITSGGYQDKPGSASYQDQLYINDGKGNFKRDTTALPQNHTSKSCVRAIDFDKDGDLDLFVGERVEPWQYPKPVSGCILRNDSKNGKIKFTDVTNTVAPGLQNIGLICDAIWTDYNGDGWPDLILAGEWMPLTFFKNQDGRFINETDSTGIGDKFGWWNCLSAGDFDNDGKIDYIAGNLGRNSFFSDNEKFPLNNYYNDFDKNGTFESITTKFMKDRYGAYKEYTTSSRDEVMDQVPSIKKQTLYYSEFAEKTIDQLFTKEAFKGTLKSHANYFATSFIRNLGNGKFDIIPLPPAAQMAPVFSMQPGDFDGDGNMDIVLAGNDYGAEVFNGRMDALNGLVLKGDGKGNFIPLSIGQSGFYIPYSGKNMVEIKNAGGVPLLAVSQNRARLKVFEGKKRPLMKFQALEK